MVEIEFDLNQNKTIIQANMNDKFQVIINKYIDKALLDPNSVYFLANGKQINLEKTIESQMNEMDKKNHQMKILVYMTDMGDKEKQQTIIKSKEIICPICKEPCRIQFENYRIKLYGCINHHISDDIKLIDFPNTQKVNLSQILCDKCKFKNKGNCPEDGFYRCLTCNQNLCLLCRQNHAMNHKVIQYDQKIYFCQKHNESIIKYCNKCNTNICFACEDHREHHSIFLGDLKPNLEEKTSLLNEMKSNRDHFNNSIKEIIKQLNELREEINI